MSDYNVGAEMPKYKCHKEVWALKIKSIARDSDKAREEQRETDGSAIITPEDGRYSPFKVDANYVHKHKPEAGGYYVVYADGYKSFSPADAFDGGYTLIGMDVAVEGKDKTVEQQIQAKGLTTPRITLADIEENIASEHYFTAEDGVGRANRGQTSVGGKNPQALSLLTFCVLVLRNGFTVTGESACASPDNFDAEIGRKIARQNAISKCWPLLGYELRSAIARGEFA